MARLDEKTRNSPCLGKPTDLLGLLSHCNRLVANLGSRLTPQEENYKKVLILKCLAINTYL